MDTQPSYALSPVLLRLRLQPLLCPLSSSSQASNYSQAVHAHGGNVQDNIMHIIVAILFLGLQLVQGSKQMQDLVMIHSVAVFFLGLQAVQGCH